MRELITSKLGSIGSPWSWKTKSWRAYISEEAPVLKGYEAKALHKKKLFMEKRIISDSIKDHLIP